MKTFDPIPYNMSFTAVVALINETRAVAELYMESDGDWKRIKERALLESIMQKEIKRLASRLDKTGVKTATVNLFDLAMVIPADILAEKCVGDFELKDHIKKSISVPTVSILFNIQNKRDAGAKKSLSRVAAMMQYSNVPADLSSRFSLEGYSDSVDAVFKGLGIR